MKQILAITNFSNPSYYYNYNKNNSHGNQEQIQSDYSLEEFDFQSSHQQEWEIVNNIFVQQQQAQYDSRLSFDYQTENHQTKKCINPDRSFKMQKPAKRAQQITNDKYSISGTSLNQVQSKLLFKKSKPNKVKKICIQMKIHKQKQSLTKMKAQKDLKQKKISNGSLSTQHTKPSTKHKQPQNKCQTIEEKQQKQSYSLHSNQFLVLGDYMYDYKDVLKVPKINKIYRNHNKMIQKAKPAQNLNQNKVIFSNQLLCQPKENINGNPNTNNLQIYDPNKLQKKVHNTIIKIQKYIMGFIQAEQFQSAKASALQNTSNLSIQKKMQLYHQLLKDSQLTKQLQIRRRSKQISEIDGVIKLCIQKVEKKSEKLSLLYGAERPLISRWKNSKLHQLEIAKKILEKLVGESQNITIGSRHLNRSFETQDKLDLIEEQIKDPLIILAKQLQMVMNEDYYPQMKKQTINLRKSLNELLKNEQFPEPRIESQTEVTQRAKMEDTKNYFTPNGVLWFFQKFFTFMVEKENFIEKLVEKLNKGYGFDVETKKIISKTKDLDKWYEFFGQGEHFINNYLIERQIYDQFEEKVLKTDPQINEQMLKFMYYFNSAIIDSFNEEFHKFRPFYPYGQPLPLIQKAGKYFQITTDSIFYFIEKSKFHIYTNYITFFAGLILPEGQIQTKQTIKYNSIKEMKLVSQEILYDWEFYNSLMPVSKSATFEQLYQQIQEQIFQQVRREIDQLRMKRS